MARLAFATGYGSRVHILTDNSSREALCGKPVYHDWAEAEDPKPADICKSCLKAGQQNGAVSWAICSTCGGSGYVVASA